MERRNCYPLTILLLCILIFTGCIQIETRIKLHEDGTATMTERVRFTKTLLDLAGQNQSELLKLLGKEQAQARMKQMGSTISFVSHKVSDAEGASKESVTVYKIQDLNKFEYVSPWFAYVDYPENSKIKCVMAPMYKSRAYGGGRAGNISVSFHHIKRPKGQARHPKDKPPPPGPAPLENQIYRKLGPVFRDMLRGFHIKFTFEAYCPIRYRPNSRGQRSGTHSVDLINFSDKDLDSWNEFFLENEEIMLDLLRWNLGSDDVVKHVKGASNNLTLPMYLPYGSRHMWWTGSGNISFRTSRPLFDKHFVGKKLDFSEWGKSKPDKLVPAKFENIGWTKKDEKREKPKQ